MKRHWMSLRFTDYEHTDVGETRTFEKIYKIHVTKTHMLVHPRRSTAVHAFRLDKIGDVTPLIHEGEEE